MIHLSLSKAEEEETKAREVTMALTREFIETIKDRAVKNAAFRIGLLQEAATVFVTGARRIRMQAMAC